MVGKLGACVRLRSVELICLALSVLASMPAASRVRDPGGRTSTVTTQPTTPNLIEMTPGFVSFVDVPVGDTYTQTVRMSNVSARALQIKGITASSADFRITGILFPVVVAPGTGESFTISYQPRRESDVEAQIRIMTGTGETPLVLKVRAKTVKDEKELTASEAAIDFEDVAVGSSGKKEVLLTNSGNRDLRISGISLSAAEFSVSGTGPVSLSPGQRIGLEVNFAPKNAGRRVGNLRVLSAEGGALLDIPLSAAGAASSQSGIKLRWEEDPSSAGGYVVYRSADPSGPYMRLSAQAVPVPEYVDTGLPAGHTYYYVVTSVGADEVESEYSAPISATVPEA